MLTVEGGFEKVGNGAFAHVCTVYPEDVAQTPPCWPKMAALAILPLPTRLVSTYAAEFETCSVVRTTRKYALLTLPRHDSTDERWEGKEVWEVVSPRQTSHSFYEC